MISNEVAVLCDACGAVNLNSLCSHDETIDRHGFPKPVDFRRRDLAGDPRRVSDFVITARRQVHDFDPLGNRAKLSAVITEVVPFLCRRSQSPSFFK